MASHHISLVGELHFKPDAPKEAIFQAFQSFGENYWYDFSIKQMVDNPWDSSPFKFYLDDDSNIQNVDVDVHIEALQYRFNDSLSDLVEQLNPYIDGATFLEAQDHDTGDSSEAVWNVWFGEGQALLDAQREHGWQVAKDALREHGFSPEEIRAAAEAIQMPYPNPPSRPSPQE